MNLTSLSLHTPASSRFKLHHHAPHAAHTHQLMHPHSMYAHMHQSHMLLHYQLITCISDLLCRHTIMIILIKDHDNTWCSLEILVCSLPLLLDMLILTIVQVGHPTGNKAIHHSLYMYPPSLCVSDLYSP